MNLLYWVRAHYAVRRLAGSDVVLEVVIVAGHEVRIYYWPPWPSWSTSSTRPAGCRWLLWDTLPGPPGPATDQRGRTFK